MNAPNDAAVSTGRVSLDQIKENPFQPRRTFDLEELAKLRDSIREYGVLQPIVVRNDGQGFQLIAGERRLRAAREAGLNEIPVQVVDFTDQQVNEAALVENIQRSDLNPIEKASGFKDYLERFSITQEQLAQRIGIDRTSISNLLGLLNLPSDVQDWVRTGQLSLGHAKVLKGVAGGERQQTLAKEVIARSLSVHALETLVKQQKAEAAGLPVPPPRQSVAEKSAHVKALETDLQQKLGLRVAIKLKSKDKGRIELHFDSNAEFERVVERLQL
ncbi:MAG: ParB/RepB/Spo0J family partition protein [Gemmataceae bacterium]